MSPIFPRDSPNSLTGSLLKRLEAVEREERAFGGDEFGEFPALGPRILRRLACVGLTEEAYRSTKIGAGEGCNTRLNGHLLQWEMNSFKHAAMTPATCGSLLFALI